MSQQRVKNQQRGKLGRISLEHSNGWTQLEITVIQKQDVAKMEMDSPTYTFAFVYYQI